MIPARGGSRGVPKKNLSIVAGESIIQRTAEVVKNLGNTVDNCLLSTDDPDIANEGKRCGIDAPFMRPKDLSSSTSIIDDVWRHAWLFAEKHYKKYFDISILLEATSPMRTATDVLNTIELLKDGKYDAAITVSPTPGALSPFKSLNVNEQGIISFFHPQGEKYKNRQSAPTVYHRNGVCYALRRETLFEKKTIIQENSCAALIIDREIANIDEPIDLKIIEMLMKDM